MSKKFVSFLGTGNYKHCIYTMKGKESHDVKFVQEALLDFLRKDFSPEDKIYILLTKEARNKHWQELKEQLDTMDLPCLVEDKDIMDSKSEADVWGLFTQIFGFLEEKDQLYFDLTHSLRYLPMLFLSILQYASYLKNIKVKGIYYGAYEVDGEKTGRAPIFNMTDAFVLTQWANAANAFTNYGVTDGLIQCVQPGSNTYEGSKQLASSLSDISTSMICSRGSEIENGQVFSQTRTLMKEFRNAGLHPPFIPLLEKVEEKIAGFKEDSIANFIPAVEWCIKHKMPQQGFTLLQEGFQSLVMSHFQLNHEDRSLRQVFASRLAGAAMQAVGKGDMFKPHRDEHKFKAQVTLWMSSDFFLQAGVLYTQIGKFRNDVNHGGINGKKYKDVYKGLKKKLKEVKQLCQKHSVF